MREYQGEILSDGAVDCSLVANQVHIVELASTD